MGMLHIVEGHGAISSIKLLLGQNVTSNMEYLGNFVPSIK